MNNKNYTKLEDFLSDTSFCKWAKEMNSSDSSSWDDWIVKNPTKRELVCEAKDILIGIQFKDIVTDIEKVEAQWKLFENKVNYRNLKNNRKKTSKASIFTGIAASILLCITIGISTFNASSEKITYTTTYGEILHLKLIDGSTVTLNSNSSLHYYKDDNRKVWLTGEAFFQVQKKRATNSKFSVVTNDLDVQVYGTSFNVDTKHQQTAVFLEEGKIALKLRNGNTENMSPGNFISYSSKKGAVIDMHKEMDSKFKTSWKDGSIIFENLPLSEAIKKIEETYGVSAIFKDDKAKEKVITGGVPITNLEICIQAIEKSVGVHIRKTGNNLIIQNKK